VFKSKKNKKKAEATGEHSDEARISGTGDHEADSAHEHDVEMAEGKK